MWLVVLSKYCFVVMVVVVSVVVLAVAVAVAVAAAVCPLFRVCMVGVSFCLLLPVLYMTRGDTESP